MFLLAAVAFVGGQRADACTAVYVGKDVSADETGRADMRVIGTDTALSVHIAQIYSYVPADICSVVW